MTSAPWQRFFPENPYEGFRLDEWRADLQGWGAKDRIFRHLIRHVRPRTIVEVGTWKGASAIEMARLVKEFSVAAEIICVDTWLGSAEHFLKRDHPSYWESLNMRHGYPQLYSQFLANVLHEGHDDVIVPLPQTSENAAIILRRRKVTADLIYIDAAHEYAPVMADLENYWSLLSDEGVLFGDDFAHAPVAQAVKDFGKRHGLRVWPTPKKFAITRPERDLPWPPD